MTTEQEQLAALAAQAEEFDQEDTAQIPHRLQDWYYDQLQGKYWSGLTGGLCIEKTVDGSVPNEDWPTEFNEDGEPRAVKPSLWLRRVVNGQVVESSTWWPGMPTQIRNYLFTEGGMISYPGGRTFNQYIPPVYNKLATATDPQPWIDHVRRLYPLEADTFFDWCAHALQRPHEKCNWGIVMAGAQGCGKDTALHPIREGVGEHNAHEIEPDEVTSGYNGWIQSVLLIINEVRPHDTTHLAREFYEKLKTVFSAPPNTKAVNRKYANLVYVKNVCHTLLTTNDPLTMHIPKEDRRVFVMDSPVQRGELGTEYFNALWKAYNSGTTKAVIDWLKARDLSAFEPGQEPPMTPGKQRIIDSSTVIRRTEVDSCIDDFLDHFKDPDVVFMKDLHDYVNYSEFDEAQDIKKQLNSKSFLFKMAERGYELERSPATKSGEWSTPHFRSKACYVRKEIPGSDRYKIIREELLNNRPLTFHHLRAVEV